MLSPGNAKLRTKESISLQNILVRLELVRLSYTLGVSSQYLMSVLITETLSQWS